MSAPRVLLIEDDADLQTLLYEVLVSEGYEVHVAMPDDVLYMVQEISPELLLIGCDGRGTFEPGWEIRAMLRREQPQVVLVMLTTSTAAVEELGQTARGRVFDGGLRKPFTIDELLRTLAAHVPSAGQAC